MINCKYSKEELDKLYDRFGSVKNVAKYLGMPVTTIRYWYVGYRKGFYRAQKRFPFSKEELEILYEKCESIGKVAAHLNRSYSTVRHWYHMYDIKTKPSGMTVFHEIRKTPMTDLQKSVILGSILGDGCAYLAPHCKNARLYIPHCEKQLPYLKWVHGLLKPFSRPIKQTEKAGKKMIMGRECQIQNFYRFWTIAHPDITSYFKRYYKNGKKGVPESLVDELDLLSLSILMADDGSVSRGKNGPTSCSIATCSFTYDEHLILVEAISKFFNGRMEIKKHSGEGREDFLLHLYDSYYVRKFIDMIKTILPKSIHYKL